MSTEEYLAFTRIGEEKRNKAGFLDLGKYGLTELPEELAELV